NRFKTVQGIFFSFLLVSQNEYMGIKNWQLYFYLLIKAEKSSVRFSSGSAKNNGSVPVFGSDRFRFDTLVYSVYRVRKIKATPGFLAAQMFYASRNAPSPP
ncbi:MAG: hypothetical protein O7C56_09000, partial [Rickettsia endosymbiont of Ixodes persulcatus]|nr:hypothetical protein [Rickettsia endosymbiont of Ixodes persulcatus]